MNNNNNIDKIFKGHIWQCPSPSHLSMEDESSFISFNLMQGIPSLGSRTLSTRIARGRDFILLPNNFRCLPCQETSPKLPMTHVKWWRLPSISLPLICFPCFTPCRLPWLAVTCKPFISKKKILGGLTKKRYLAAVCKKQCN